MTSRYEKLDKDDEKLFQTHSKGIDKAVRETFSSIPANFQLKPVTIRKERGCGMFYHFKIALPDRKFANVSFHTGGYPIPTIAGTKEKETEQRFNVDPTSSSSEYE